jgi:predicted Ser/Thr protein kinase
MSCPDENELVRFARGGLAEDAALTFSSHLDSCPPCRRAVAEAASEEPLVAPAVATGARVGRYEVDALLGSGAMGAVFSARDLSLDRRVAIKLLHSAGDEQSRARLEREAQAMARLSHPHVVTVHELGDWSGGRFIAMELVEGKTLDAWLPSATPAERRKVLLDAGHGLSAAHQAGVVHRDFKPRNLLVGRDGRVRVTDFGLSRATANASGPLPESLLRTAQGALVGTPAWMSPEQLDGRLADERSDQFAFCVVWVEALTGRRPFAGETRAELRESMRAEPSLAGLSAHERAALRRGLSEDPAARFESLESLLQAIAGTSRRWWPWVGAVLLAVFLLVGAAFAWPRALPALPTALEVDVGKMFPMKLKCLSRIAVGDPAIVDVKTVDEQELVLIGMKPGETTLLLWDCNNSRSSFTVRVAAPKQ